jgi:hypothetical protein
MLSHKYILNKICAVFCYLRFVIFFLSMNYMNSCAQWQKKFHNYCTIFDRRFFTITHIFSYMIYPVCMFSVDLGILDCEISLHLRNKRFCIYYRREQSLCMVWRSPICSWVTFFTSDRFSSIHISQCTVTTKINKKATKNQVWFLLLTHDFFSQQIPIIILVLRFIDDEWTKTFQT